MAGVPLPTTNAIKNYGKSRGRTKKVEKTRNSDNKLMMKKQTTEQFDELSKKSNKEQSEDI